MRRKTNLYEAKFSTRQTFEKVKVPPCGSTLQDHRTLQQIVLVAYTLQFCCMSCLSARVRPERWCWQGLKPCHPSQKQRREKGSLLGTSKQEMRAEKSRGEANRATFVCTGIAITPTTSVRRLAHDATAAITTHFNSGTIPCSLWPSYRSFKARFQQFEGLTTREEGRPASDSHEKSSTSSWGRSQGPRQLLGPNPLEHPMSHLLALAPFRSFVLLFLFFSLSFLVSLISPLILFSVPLLPRPIRASAASLLLLLLSFSILHRFTPTTPFVNHIVVSMRGRAARLTRLHRVRPTCQNLKIIDCTPRGQCPCIG